MSSKVSGTADASLVKTLALIGYPELVRPAVQRLGGFFGRHLRGA